MIRRATPKDISDILPHTVGETEAELEYAMTRSYAAWVTDGERGFLQVAADPELRIVQVGSLYPTEGLGARRALALIKGGLAEFWHDYPDTRDWYTFALVEPGFDDLATFLKRSFRPRTGVAEVDAKLERFPSGYRVVSLPTLQMVYERAQAWRASP